MSRMFEQIRAWYESGLWSKKRVLDAVVKGRLTAEEYRLITGEEANNDG